MAARGTLSWAAALTLLMLTVLVLLTLLTPPAAAARRKQMVMMSRINGRSKGPRFYGHDVAEYHLDPSYPKVRRKLTQYHNRFRSRVKPRAANMLRLKWHAGAAKDAQNWADRCQMLIHANETARYQQNFGACGQNIFVSTHKVPWYFAIKSWFLEKNMFKFGADTNNLFEIGHYTQMVWYSTHKVGCGWAHCKQAAPTPYYNYVCNYCPTGNYNHRLGRPYEAGRPCSKCRRTCNSKKRLCTNSCPWRDIWSNCADLEERDRSWTCGAGEPGKSCQATCRCSGRIH